MSSPTEPSNEPLPFRSVMEDEAPILPLLTARGLDLSDEALEHTVSELRRIAAQPTVLRAYVEKPASKKKSRVSGKIDVDALLADYDDEGESDE